MTENDLVIEIAEYMSGINKLSVEENIKLLADKSAELLPTLKIKWEDLYDLIFPLAKRLNIKISNQTYWDIRFIGDLLNAFSPAVKKSPSTNKLPYQEKNMREAINQAASALYQEQPDGRPSTSKCEGLDAIG